MTTDAVTRRAGSPAASRPSVASAGRVRADQSASWPTILAWGAGLVAIATGAASVVGDTSALSRALGVVLALAGAALFAGGAIALARGRFPALGAVPFAAAATLALLVGALVADPAGVSILGVAAGAALLLLLAAVTARAARRPATSARMGLIGMFAAAVIVAAIATPALSAVQSARLTSDNGGVPVVIEHHH